MIKDRQKVAVEVTPERVYARTGTQPAVNVQFSVEGFNQKIKTQTVVDEGQVAVAYEPSQDHQLTLQDILSVTSANFYDDWRFRSAMPFFYFPVMAPAGKGEALSFQVHSERLRFGDNGNEDYVGLMSLLARADQINRRLILLVNTKDKLTKRSQTGEVTIESVLPTYFGYNVNLKAEPQESMYTPYGEGLSRCTVNAERNHVFPRERFHELVSTLYKKKQNGEPLVFLQQRLPILRNDCYGIPQQQAVDILWVYNDLPKDWLDDKRVSPIKKAVVERFMGEWPAVSETEEKTNLFPNYRTGADIHLNAAQTNLLYYLGYWTMTESEGVIRRWLSDEGKR